MNKWTFSLILVLLAGVVIVAVVTNITRPAALAVANRIERQTGIVLAEQDAAARLRGEEDEATSAARVATIRAVFYTGAFVVGIVGAAVVFRAGGDMVTTSKTARLPVARQIAPGTYVARLADGVWLIDSYSGRRALLSQPQDVDLMRAEIVTRKLTVDRLAEAAESIAANTGDPAPGDWLAHIGQRNDKIKELQK
ncbi:MAG: hypothetical protein GY803_27550 [Chloroflexi bacterium]|nr:hypothetical protein [Chloroflexota bacterium]